MNERIWTTSRDPQRMLTYISGRESDRKLRLVAVACANRAKDLMPQVSNVVLAAIEIAEQHADGTVPKDVVTRTIDVIDWYTEKVWEDVFAYPQGEAKDFSLVDFEKGITFQTVALVAQTAKFALLGNIQRCVDSAINAIQEVESVTSDEDSKEEDFWDDGDGDEDEDEDGEEDAQGDESSDSGVWVCDLFREIVGNPFQPVVFDLSWRSPDVYLEARSIYDDQRFERTPALADRLEKNGCDSPIILDHLRTPGHVRGCWAVDLVLGKG